MKRTVWFCTFFLLPGCAADPLSKALNLQRQPRLGIGGFKVTAPTKRLSSIVQTIPENLSTEEELPLLAEQLRKIEDRAANFLADELREWNKVEAVLVAEDGTRRGEPPTTAQLEVLRKELNLDAVLSPFCKLPHVSSAGGLSRILGSSIFCTMGPEHHCSQRLSLTSERL